MFDDPKAIAIALLAALVAVLTYMGRDALKRLKELEDNAADRPYVDAKHQENVGRFNRIEDRIDAGFQKIDAGVTGTHQRIDQLYADLPEMIRNSK